MFTSEFIALLSSCDNEQSGLQGKFLRGLETSIEVLNQAESSHSDMGS